MIFTFAYERTIDAKNRLQIPAPWRAAWDPSRDRPVVYICPGVRENTLSLYTEAYFENRASQMQTEYMDAPDSLDFEQAFFAAVLRQELDGQGRVTFPEEILGMVDLGREVVLAGAKVRIDIWRKSDYEAFRATDMSKRWETFRKYMRMPARAAEEYGPQ